MLLISHPVYGIFVVAAWDNTDKDSAKFWQKEGFLWRLCKCSLGCGGGEMEAEWQGSRGQEMPRQGPPQPASCWSQKTPERRYLIRWSRQAPGRAPNIVGEPPDPKHLCGQQLGHLGDSLHRWIAVAPPNKPAEIAFQRSRSFSWSIGWD